MSELGKPFPKKLIKIKTKQKIKVKMPHVNKKTTSEKGKSGSNKKTRPRMKYEWIGKTIKKSDPKIRKTVKNQSEIAASETKNH